MKGKKDKRSKQKKHLQWTAFEKMVEKILVKQQ
jgi:hypothetical protein